MEPDLVDLEGLFQNEEDLPALRLLWRCLQPRDRVQLLAVSWHLRAGLDRVILLLVVRQGF